MEGFEKRSGSTMNGRKAVLLGAFLLLCVLGAVVVWKQYSSSSPEEALPPSADGRTDGRSPSSTLPKETPVVRVAPELGHAESVLELAPESVSVIPGQHFSLDATVQPGNNRVSGVELRVKYDPKKMKLENIQASKSFNLELQSAKINNTDGTASIALGTQLTESSVDSKQTVATLFFTVLGSTGSARVEIAPESLVSADRESQNVLKAVRSAQIDVLER